MFTVVLAAVGWTATEVLSVLRLIGVLVVLCFGYGRMRRRR
jgi:hypothetical protein